MLLKSCKILNGCLVIKKTRTESFNSGFKSGRMDSNHRYPAPKAGAIAARRRPESTKASICEKENEVNSKCKFCYCFSKVKASRKEWFCIRFLVSWAKRLIKDFTLHLSLRYSLSVVLGITLTMLSVVFRQRCQDHKAELIGRWNKSWLEDAISVAREQFQAL